MKNQEVMITQFQRFLATLSPVLLRRLPHHILAYEHSDDQAVVLTRVSLYQMVLQ
jgi:hypothetical protein